MNTDNKLSCAKELWTFDSKFLHISISPLVSFENFSLTLSPSAQQSADWIDNKNLNISVFETKLIG